MISKHSHQMFNETEKDVTVQFSAIVEKSRKNQQELTIDRNAWKLWYRISLSSLAQLRDFCLSSTHLMLPETEEEHMVNTAFANHYWYRDYYIQAIHRLLINF